MDTPFTPPTEPAPEARPVIRPYADGEANLVLSLMREVFLDELGWDRAFLIDAARVLIEILDDYSPDKDLFLVCPSKEKIAGIMVLLSAGQATGFIRWLVLGRAIRGIGLGQQLIERAVQFARDSGWARLRLVTVRELSRAYDFYLKAGFHEVKRRPDILWRKSHHLCFMEKEV